MQKEQKKIDHNEGPFWTCSRFLMLDNDGEMLDNDDEMLVNDGEMLANDGEMSI